MNFQFKFTQMMWIISYFPYFCDFLCVFYNFTFPIGSKISSMILWFNTTPRPKQDIWSVARLYIGGWLMHKWSLINRSKIDSNTTLIFGLGLEKINLLKRRKKFDTENMWPCFLVSNSTPEVNLGWRLSYFIYGLFWAYGTRQHDLSPSPRSCIRSQPWQHYLLAIWHWAN